MPIVIAFVDLKSNDKKVASESINLVNNILPEVAPAFFYGVLMTYVDNNIYNAHRKILGITHSRVPAISINNNEMKVVPYP
jgi:hypothetical protein